MDDEWKELRRIDKGMMENPNKAYTEGGLVFLPRKGTHARRRYGLRVRQRVASPSDTEWTGTEVILSVYHRVENGGRIFKFFISMRRTRRGHLLRVATNISDEKLRVFLRPFGIDAVCIRILYPVVESLPNGRIIKRGVISFVYPYL